MKYRAMIRQSGEWWIGWLVDLPGVNAQEHTREQLLESLRIGAEDMLATDVPFEPDATMAVVEVPDREWAVAESRGAYRAKGGARSRALAPRVARP